jgi:hypothetical protein
VSSYAKERRSNICFLEKITPLSLIAAIRDTREATTVFCFEKPAPYLCGVIRLLQFCHLFPTDFQEVKNHIGDVRDAEGQSTLFKVQASVANCERAISRDRDSTADLIRSLDKLWNPRLVTLVFQQSVEREIRPEVYRVDLCQWLARNYDNDGFGRMSLYVSFGRFRTVLQKYALEQGFVLKTFPDFPVLRFCCRGAASILSLEKARRFSLRAFSLLRASIFRESTSQTANNHLSESGNNGTSPRLGTIAVASNNSEFSVSKARRTEWTWLQALELDYAKVIIFNYKSSSTLDATARDFLSEKQVTIYGAAPDVRAWIPTTKCLTILLGVIRALGVGLLTNFRKRQKIPLNDIRQLLGLAIRYAYWLDFYSANGVLINVGLTDTGIPQTLALEKLGSISIGYQHSIGFLSNHVPQRYMVGGETIRFIYSKPFQELFEKAADVDTLFVQTGPILGSDFNPHAQESSLRPLRKKILASGATFVLGYFDEGSADDFDIPCSNEDATLVYEYLFRWILRDSTLGLIIKPKTPGTLLTRISRIQNLVKKGIDSGRVCMLGVEQGEKYYAGAVGEIVDVCIGHLIGGSASFEAAQTGVPSVLVDEFDCPDHELRKWCGASTIFNSLQDAELAISQFRSNPKEVAHLGDWSNAFEHLDPFGDRRGLFRMTDCISELFTSLEAGASSSRAVELLAARYVNKWGGKFVGKREAVHFPVSEKRLS